VELLQPVSKEILLTEEQIRLRVAELAAKISQDYSGQSILMVGILKGAVIFFADLIRCLTVPVAIDFMSVSSYGKASESSGAVRIIKDLDQSIEGRHVILVEDIVDTGLTLKRLTEILDARRPASLKICTLLDKPDRRKVEIMPDYNGFIIPDEFVVGYGLDYDEKYRNLRGILMLTPEDLANI